ncbi:MAG: hypothetical protein JXR58_04365 [Bacteroidales bacterium]|nr:hypothetical protein [Bacteroidales bacterium]
MKTITIFAFFSLLILISSCNKDDVFEASMSASIDGTSWSAVTRVTKKTNGKFIITGTSTDQKVIVLTVYGVNEGTYELSAGMDSVDFQFSAVYQPEASSPSENNYLSKSGTIKISKLDTENQRISGTFNFSATKLSETITISNGEFKDLKYSE